MQKDKQQAARRIFHWALVLAILSFFFDADIVAGLRAASPHASLTERNLEDDATKWGVFVEQSPTWRLDNLNTPSLDGRALRCAITGGLPSSNVHCYRNLSAEPDARLFAMSMSFYYRPASTFNNKGNPSIVQALEFTMSKWDQGMRYEWAVQWDNVDNDTNTGTPEWRYWGQVSPNGPVDWLDLGIPAELTANQWHTLKLEGEILADKVHYLRFQIDDKIYPLTHLTADPVLDDEPDKRAVAVQLDGNSTQTPYELIVDQVSLTSPENVFTYIPPYGTPIPGPDTLTGRVLNVVPAEYYLVCYIQVDNGSWWIKPNTTNWETTIRDSLDPTGSNWQCHIGTGGIDPTTKRIEVYLIPKTRRSATAPARSWADLNSVAKFVTSRTKVDVYIGQSTNPIGSSLMVSWDSLRASFANVSDGPVKVVSTNKPFGLAPNHDIPIVAAERVVYRVNGVNTSFSEMMGLPNHQLSKVYWLPWYNNRELDTQLRIANASDSPTAVHVYIAGQEMQGSPFTIPARGSVRKSFAGVNNGPVKVAGDQNIVVAERVIYRVNAVNTSFIEMMALPDGQAGKTYWLPWYNNTGDLDTQLRIANISNSNANVQVYIGGQEMQGSPFSLMPGASTRKSFAVNNGPVRIVSTQNIVAAERVVYKVNGIPTSFSEMMALPSSQLGTMYWLPWYNNTGDLDTQLRIANVSTSTATVRVYIKGQEMPGSPFTLAAGASTRKSFVGINKGPVQILSDVNIVAAERVVYKVNGVNTSFSEMMALPNSQLSTLYWLPWYNNVELDTQLRFGVP